MEGQNMVICVLSITEKLILKIKAVLASLSGKMV
jgi:hypothetical protein